MTAQVIHGDCINVLAGMGDNTVDAIVTDPPYEIGFMGKGWDGSGIAYRVELWAECLRVLKPGGHLLAFGGTRTYHRMASAIDDAGFDIRDSLHWLYGSGFPKSLDVSKAIDKAAGAQREVVGTKRLGGNAAQTTAEKGGTYASNTNSVGVQAIDVPVTAPVTDAAKQWSGWGTALKPAHEPIVVARKPLTGTVAATAITHGTGALNIDGCRVGTNAGWSYPNGAGGNTFHGQDRHTEPEVSTAGRWPANLVFTHAADCADECADGCPVAELDRQSGTRTSGLMKAGTKTKGYDGPSMGEWKPGEVRTDTYADSGGASRFFTVTEWDPTADVPPFRYVAKPSKRERNAGLDGLPEQNKYKAGGVGGTGGWRSVEAAVNATPVANHHPTVKPVALMRWLVRLVTPPGGTVLDPFAGSGTTLVAATLEGCDAIGIEMTDDYHPIIAGRVQWAEAQADAPPDTLFDPRTAT